MTGLACVEYKEDLYEEAGLVELVRKYLVKDIPQNHLPTSASQTVGSADCLAGTEFCYA